MYVQNISIVVKDGQYGGERRCEVFDHGHLILSAKSMAALGTMEDIFNEVRMRSLDRDLAAMTKEYEINQAFWGDG